MLGRGAEVHNGCQAAARVSLEFCDTLCPKGKSKLGGNFRPRVLRTRPSWRSYELTNPGLGLTVTTEVFDGAALTIISVPRSPDVHQVKGRSTERVGTSCEPMTNARIAVVLADRRGDDWSDTDSGVAPSHIPARAEDEVRARLEASSDPERQAWATLSLLDITRRLGLLSPGGNLTNAGVVLLIGRPGSEIDYIHRRTRSGQLTTNERLTGPALITVAKSWNSSTFGQSERPSICPTDSSFLWLTSQTMPYVRQW